MINWRKSTHSGEDNAQCVEVAAIDNTIGVRDSKNPQQGHLTIVPSAFAELVQRIKNQ